MRSSSSFQALYVQAVGDWAAFVIANPVNDGRNFRVQQNHRGPGIDQASSVVVPPPVVITASLPILASRARCSQRRKWSSPNLAKISRIVSFSLSTMAWSKSIYSLFSFFASKSPTVIFPHAMKPTNTILILSTLYNLKIKTTCLEDVSNPDGCISIKKWALAPAMLD